MSGRFSARPAIKCALRWILVVAVLASSCSFASASDARSFLTKGAVAIANLEFNRAIDFFSEGLEQQQSVADRVELLRMRGLAFDLAKKPDRAEADYTAVIDLVGGSDPRAYSKRGYFYFYHGRLDRALADYSAGARLFPNDGEFPNGQGNVLSNQGKFDDAIGRFDEAVRLDPASGTFLLGRAEAYVRSGRPERALDDYDRALTRGNLTQREKGRLRNGRGYAYLTLKNYNAAVEEFNTALTLRPGLVNAWKWRALAYERLGNIGNAIRDYEAALKLKPTDDAVARRLRELQGR